MCVYTCSLISKSYHTSARLVCKSSIQWERRLPGNYEEKYCWKEPPGRLQAIATTRIYRGGG